MTSVTAIACLILIYIGKFPTLLVYSHLLQGLTNIGYQNCILSSRLGIHKELLPPFQIVSRSDFSSCIAFTMYLDIMHIQVHSYVPKKAKNGLQYGAGGVVANINHEAR